MWKKKYKIAIAAALLLFSILAVDYYVGYKQNKYLAEKAILKNKIERLAWYSLRGEIKDVAYQGHKYRVLLKFENAFPEEEMYIMIPQIRCLVQVGTLWKEVPVNDTGHPGEDTGVTKLEGSKIIEKMIEVPFKNFEEVLPGYMHVRINAISYVASDTISKEDIVEKNEDFYIYLKPYYADNRKMSKKYTFTNNDVPIFIPMPPH